MTQTVPSVIFKTRVRDEAIGGDNPFRWLDVNSDEVFKGRRVVVFALPGAFTPTCSSTHLPGYDAKYQDFRDAGIDEVYCLSVNDAFSMFQWAKQLGVRNVKMLPDGNGAFTRAMGMMVKKENLGFGERSWRYAMLVEDGRITKLLAEDGMSDNCETDPFECSDCDTMLEFIRSNAEQAA